MNFIEYLIINITKGIVLIDDFNEFKFDPVRIDKREFSTEEYKDLCQGRIVGKDGFLYEIQGDGSIMMIDVCE